MNAMFQSKEVILAIVLVLVIVVVIVQKVKLFRIS